MAMECLCIRSKNPCVHTMFKIALIANKFSSKLPFAKLQPGSRKGCGSRSAKYIFLEF